MSLSRRTARALNHDPDKLAFIRQQRCLVWCLDAEGCRGRVEVNHIRVRGGKRDDALTVPLCAAHHRTGDLSYHQLGRKGFEKEFEVDLAAEAGWYHAKYQNWKRAA